MYNSIVGIDEAGRGPLAGPVALGICMVSRDFDFGVFGVLRDSKKLSEKRREEIFKLMQNLKKQEKIQYAVALVPNTVIDRIGITGAIREGIIGVIKKLSVDSKTSFIYLDGGLVAPDEFKQETIIKGDEKISVISLASIAAKVTRDRYMKDLASDYPEYGFEIHKGYGTLKHRDAIQKHGLSDIHRSTFCHF